MAVTNLKLFFSKNFFEQTLTNHKLIFANCKFFSVMTEPSSFLLQPNFIWSAVSFSNYWLYDFNDRNFQKLLYIFWLVSYYWLLLNPYHIIQILITPIGLEKNVQWITDKVFREKPLVYLTSTLSSCTLLQKFWFFPCFWCCFHNLVTYGDVLLITEVWQTEVWQTSHWRLSELIYWFLLKTIDFKGCSDLMAVQNSKNCFWTLTNLEFFLWTVWQSQIKQVFYCNQNNLVRGFIVYLLVLNLQFHEFS